MRVFVGPLLLGFALAIVGPVRAWSQPAAPDPPDPDNAGDDSAPVRGTLVVTAKDRKGAAIDGAVEIDNKPMGELEDGEMTLVNIPEGRHSIRIAAAGFQSFEQAVMVRAGQQARLEAQLVVKVVPSKAAAWKWTLGGSIAALGLGGSYGYYSRFKMMRNRDAVQVVEAPHEGEPLHFILIEPEDCPKSAMRIAAEKNSIVVNKDRFDRMCTWRARSQIGYVVGGVGLVGVLVSVYMLTLGGDSEPVARAGRHRAPMIAIVPTMTPDGGGASLSLAW